MVTQIVNPKVDGECENVLLWHSEVDTILVGIYSGKGIEKFGHFLYHDDAKDIYRRAPVPPTILFSNMALWHIIQLNLLERGITLKHQPPANCIGPPDIAHL